MATAPGTGNAVCAQCSSCVPPGNGYAVYSECIEGIAADHRVFFSTVGSAGTEKGDIESRPLDATLYCGFRVRPELFRKQMVSASLALKENGVLRQLETPRRALRVEMDPGDANSPEGKEARFEVINFGIALRAKRRGISHLQARSEARLLGDLWWKDQIVAKRNPLAQSPPARIRPAVGHNANGPMLPSYGSPATRWGWLILLALFIAGLFLIQWGARGLRGAESFRDSAFIIGIGIFTAAVPFLPLAFRAMDRKKVSFTMLLPNVLVAALQRPGWWRSIEIFCGFAFAAGFGAMCIYSLWESIHGMDKWFWVVLCGPAGGIAFREALKEWRRHRALLQATSELSESIGRSRNDLFEAAPETTSSVDEAPGLFDSFIEIDNSPVDIVRPAADPNASLSENS